MCAFVRMLSCVLIVRVRRYTFACLFVCMFGLFVDLLLCMSVNGRLCASVCVCLFVRVFASSLVHVFVCLFDCLVLFGLRICVCVACLFVCVEGVCVC